MNTSTWRYFEDAMEVAIKGEERRHFFLGAVGVRNDGTVVRSHNKSTLLQDRRFHAEYRLLKKLDVGSTVYVARITKGGRIAACARPCESCLNAMLKRGVKRVYWTLSEEAFDWMDL